METSDRHQAHSARPTYKSPLRKLLSFFQKSRDLWKAKCLAAKRLVKQFKNRTRFLERSKEHWKRRTQELKEQHESLGEETVRLQTEVQAANEQLATLKSGAFPEKPPTLSGTSFAKRIPRHRYSLGEIQLFTALVVSAATSLRSASRVIETIRVLLQVPLISPSWQTGRLWLLRLGYYKLTRGKERADDWVWIVDHSVQLGSIKCLVVLGIRLESLSVLGRALRHEDVEPIAIAPMKESKGRTVFRQLEAGSRKTGIPREILEDRGSDLKAGIEQFCRKHPETCSIYDVKHQAAIVLKHEFVNDVAWQAFVQLASKSKKRVQQTELAHLAPPKQQAKSRYMNIGRLLRWGKRILAFLGRNCEGDAKQVDADRLEATFGWIKMFSPHLREWEEVLQLAEATVRFVREKGFYRQCPRDLKRVLSPLLRTARGAKVCQQLLAYARAESKKAKPRERLLGSSEVIESVFGRWKRLEGEQAHSGFTGLLLAIGAMVAPTTTDTVQQALETVSTQEVTAWSRQQLGPTVQAKRKQDLTPRTE